MSRSTQQRATCATRASGSSLAKGPKCDILIDGLTLVKQELPLREMAPVLITGAMEYDLIGVRA